MKISQKLKRLQFVGLAVLLVGCLKYSLEKPAQEDAC